MAAEFDFDDDIEEIKSGRLSDEAGLTREISVRTYRTGHRFDRDKFLAGLDAGRLPKLGKFGKVETFSGPDEAEIRVVLARQEETRVRTWDDEHDLVRWWRWQHTIVDTIAVRYWADEEGFVRFMTFGGGRIKFWMIEQFHHRHLGIEKGTSDVVAIDPMLLRARCFAPDFADKLHAIKARVAKKGYESIDHAAYTSRRYIKPDVDRLKDIRDDPAAVVEAFDSVVEAGTSDLSRSVLARFVVSAGSGSIRLRFPRIYYRDNLKSLRAQTRAFYVLCEETVRRIVGPGLESSDEIDPADLEAGNSLLSAVTSTTKHERWLSNALNRAKFFARLDVYDADLRWLPHVRALDALLARAPVPGLGAELETLTSSDPWQMAFLLGQCRSRSLLHLGRVCARALTGQFAEIHGMEARCRCDDALLAWALEHEDADWSFDADHDALNVLGRQLRLARLEERIQARALLRCASAAHAELTTGVTNARLSRLHWTLQRVADLPFDDDAPLAAKLLAGHHVPGAARDLTPFFAAPLDSDDDVARAAWNEADLPLWPCFDASWSSEGLSLSNVGFGATTVSIAGMPEAHLRAGGSLSLGVIDARELAISFRRIGVDHAVSIVVPARAPKPTPTRRPAQRPVSAMSRAELADLRAEMDPEQIVVGEHESVYALFEKIWSANNQRRLPHMFILGDTGTGKTHLARVIHRSSRRKAGPFHKASAQAGGNPDILRAEWVGAAPKSGVANMPDEGRQGHLERAGGGTLFIDDCERLSDDAQHLLLAATDDPPGTMSGVGGKQLTPEARVIFATNHDIDAMVAGGAFRGDLRFRAQQTLRLPPLRERTLDVVLLARHFAKKERVRLTERALVALMRFDWPGNVRQLKEAIEAGGGAARAVAARRKEEGAASGEGYADVGLEHLHTLPDAHREAVATLADDECRREFWTAVASAAAAEGAEPNRRNGGLNARMAEISGFDKGHVSRMHRQWVLGEASA